MLRRLLLLVVAAALVGGCASLTPCRRADGGADSPPAVRRASALRAEAVVTIGRDGLRGRALVLVKAPSLFRIEVYGPFDQVAAVLAGDGPRLVYYRGGDRRSLSLDTPLFSGRFSPMELTGLLLGDTAALERMGAEVRTRDEEGAAVTEVVKTSGGVTLYRARFAETGDTSGVELPRAITITNGRDSLAIRYLTVEVDPLLDDDLFAL
ncbi:MAG TPA: hypothetical protein ENJ37_04470 [Deltaproteobacteria bacterium]|nr:hypothetical protein [Deltaproteobacteria bacterium]